MVVKSLKKMLLCVFVLVPFFSNEAKVKKDISEKKVVVLFVNKNKVIETMPNFKSTKDAIERFARDKQAELQEKGKKFQPKYNRLGKLSDKIEKLKESELDFDDDEQKSIAELQAEKSTLENEFMLLQQEGQQLQIIIDDYTKKLMEPLYENFVKISDEISEELSLKDCIVVIMDSSNICNSSSFLNSKDIDLMFLFEEKIANQAKTVRGKNAQKPVNKNPKK